MVAIDRSQSLNCNSHGFWYVRICLTMSERALDNHEVSFYEVEIGNIRAAYIQHDNLLYRFHIRVVAQFRSGHGPIPVLFECYRIRIDSGMPRLDIRFSTSHLMMASTR